MSKVVARRKQLPVPCHPATCMGDYVPFHFCPRSVMLYGERSSSSLTVSPASSASRPSSSAARSPSVSGSSTPLPVGTARLRAPRLIVGVGHVDDVPVPHRVLRQPGRLRSRQRGLALLLVRSVRPDEAVRTARLVPLEDRTASVPPEAGGPRRSYATQLRLVSREQRPPSTVHGIVGTDSITDAAVAATCSVVVSTCLNITGYAADTASAAARARVKSRRRFSARGSAWNHCEVPLLIRHVSTPPRRHPPPVSSRPLPPSAVRRLVAPLNAVNDHPSRGFQTRSRRCATCQPLYGTLQEPLQCAWTQSASAPRQRILPCRGWPSGPASGFSRNSLVAREDHSTRYFNRRPDPLRDPREG